MLDHGVQAEVLSVLSGSPTEHLEETYGKTKGNSLSMRPHTSYTTSRFAAALINIVIFSCCILCIIHVTIFC